MKAFPSPHDPRTGSMQLGMDLRDYFAAMAMQALIASNTDKSGDAVPIIISASYAIANAMIEARDR